MKKGKKKISATKQKTLKHSKLKKQGKLRGTTHKKKSLLKKKSRYPVPNPEPIEEEGSDHGEDMLQMIEKEDLDFLRQAINTDSYSLLSNLNYKENRSDNKRKRVENEEEIDVEGQYEETAEAQKETKKIKHLLPIKTKDGLIHQTMEVDLKEDEEETKSKKPEPISKPEEDVDSDMELIADVKNDESDIFVPTRPVSTAELLAAREESLRKRKLLIGSLASGLLEDPQLKAKNFKLLLDMMTNESRPELRITVCKLAVISLLEVFKDVIPSYQIKHQENTAVKLKKETMRLQGYEKSLLSSYKSYLQKLEKFISVLDTRKRKSKPSQGEVRLAELALQCMCDLLTTHPYFNFSQNLAQMMVPFLNHHMIKVREMCAKCLRTVFKSDTRGQISLDIVRRINHLVKSRSHSVHPEVLNVLLSLRIKEINLEKEKEDELKQKKLMNHKQRLISLSRMERKRNKQLEALEKVLKETKAQENKETKQHFLTEITKMVFTIYFRVLKRAPSSKILSITLEGLARYAHCINLEFYQDIVNVLNQLLENEPLGYREQLHCVQTVFTILSGQGEVLNIDPLRFYVHLYRNLFLVHAGSSHPDTLSILQTLEKSVIQRRKKISQQRIFAFTKRLATLAMQLLHNGALGCLATIKTIMQLNRSVDILLDPDTSVGQGIYYPELEDPEYCNASSTAMWELVTLEHHYHPTVRKFARNIILGVPTTGEGSIASELAKLKAEDMFSEFDPSEMVFKPTVPAPKKIVSKSRPPSHFHLKNDDLANYVKQISEKRIKGPLDFSKNLFQNEKETSYC